MLFKNYEHLMKKKEKIFECLFKIIKEIKTNFLKYFFLILVSVLLIFLFTFFFRFRLIYSSEIFCIKFYYFINRIS